MTIYIGKTARETYIQTIIRRELMLNALQINQKIIGYRLFHRAIDETFKIPEKCWPFLYLNFTRLLQLTFISPRLLDGYHYCLCTNGQLFL